MCLNSLAPARLEIFLRDSMLFDCLLPSHTAATNWWMWAKNRVFYTVCVLFFHICLVWSNSMVVCLCDTYVHICKSSIRKEKQKCTVRSAIHFPQPTDREFKWLAMLEPQARQYRHSSPSLLFPLNVVVCLNFFFISRANAISHNFFHYFTVILPVSPLY